MVIGHENPGISEPVIFWKPLIVFLGLLMGATETLFSKPDRNKRLADNAGVDKRRMIKNTKAI